MAMAGIRLRLWRRSVPSLNGAFELKSFLLLFS
jgi:hypothetical protein